MLKLSVKLSGPRLLFVGIFLITFSISLLVIVLFIFSNSSWFSLESMHVFFQEFIHFSQVVIFYWISVVYGSLYDPLYIWVVSCDFFFISNFIESLLFFSWGVWRFINFVYLLKEPTFTFMDLCYYFLVSYFIYFWSDLYDFLSSVDLGFSFSSFSSWLDCLFEIFFLFLEVRLNCCKLPF